MKKLLDQILHSAWQPLTPRGVAAFSRASLGRVLLVQFLVAAFVAVSVVWFLETAWFPVAREAIQQLPDTGEIRRGELVWHGDSPVRLAAGHFLSLAVDVWHEGNLGNESHLSVEFGRTDIRLRSLLGYAELIYPRDWKVEFNQSRLEPWFGAWSPWILAGAAAAVVVGLFVSWFALATLYWLPVWVLAFFANRDLGWRGSWRLAAAALLPGAIFLTLDIVAYGLCMVDLVGLGWGFGFHFVIGWIYVLAGVMLTPRHPAATVAAKNPFVQS